MKKLYILSIMILMSILMLQNVSPALTDNLFNYFDLNNNSLPLMNNITGRGIFYSASNNYNTGAKGLLGNGVGFYASSSSNGGVFTSNITQNGGQAITVNLWYKSNGTTQTSFYCPFASKHNDVGNQRSWLMIANTRDSGRTGSQFKFQISNDGSDYDKYCMNNNNTFVNTWVMLTSVWNGTHIKVYFNGTLENSCPFTSNLAQSSANILLGAFTGGGGSPVANACNGTIDEFGVWNRSLTDSEITQLFNSGAGFGYPFSSAAPYYYNVSFINRTPSDITTSNALGNGANFTYFVNMTSFNYSSPYINWTVQTDRTYWMTVNGSGQSLYKTSTYYNNISFNYSFWLDDNDIYPGVHNLDDELFTNTPHSFEALSVSDYLKTSLYGISPTTNISVVEIMVNGTGICRLFYCNSSYTTGNPNLNQNCNEFGDFNGVFFNHSVNQSRHNIFSFPIFNQSSGNVKVTNLSYFLVKGVLSGGCTVGYVNYTTRTDTSQLSTNMGISYTNKTYTADLHVHQYSGNDIISWNVCAKNTTGGTYCSSILTDNLDVSPTPPTNVQIYSPNGNITDILIVNYSASVPYNSSVNISRYEVMLYYENLTFNQLLINNTKLLYHSFNITLLGYPYTSFIVRVNAFDTNGLSSTEYSEIYYNVAPSPPADTLSNALLADINATLSQIRNTQQIDSGGVSMIGLYILLSVMIALTFIIRHPSLNLITAILSIFIGIKSISLGGTDAIIGVIVASFGMMLVGFMFLSGNNDED